jgi:prepilin-type processing-associated H-X9-DG protein
MKQLGIALHNFHDTYKRIPSHGWDSFWTKGFTSPSVCGGQRMHGADVYSVHVSLLAFMEQTQLHAELTSALSYAASQNDDVGTFTPMPWNRTYTNSNGSTVISPLTRFIGYFICPSDEAARIDENSNTGRTNYRANNFGDSNAPCDWYGRGVFGQERIEEDRKNVMGKRSFAAITDGTSNTIAFSESCVSGENDVRIKSSIAVTSTDANFPDNITPADCALVRGVGGDLDLTGNFDGSWAGKGHRWADSRQPFTGMNTILPPNSPSCGRSNIEWFSLCTPSSYHSGGVNTCMADGAVRFISETIDCGIQTQHLGPTGHSGYCRDLTTPSTYGVWGALGSRAAGDSSSF